MNKIILFTYTGFLFISLICLKTRRSNESKLKNLTTNHMVQVVGMGVMFVLIYDLWTNFGWWYLMYPPTIQTLSMVYLAGIPFMIYHMLSAAFTFALIAIPISYLVYHKIELPQGLNQARWDHIPLILVTMGLLIITFLG